MLFFNKNTWLTRKIREKTEATRGENTKPITQRIWVLEAVYLIRQITHTYLKFVIHCEAKVYGLSAKRVLSYFCPVCRRYKQLEESTNIKITVAFVVYVLQNRKPTWSLILYFEYRYILLDSFIFCFLIVFYNH